MRGMEGMNKENRGFLENSMLGAAGLALSSLLLAGQVQADATQIYFTHDTTADSAANVLLVLDYSGSMKLAPDGSLLADDDPGSRLNIMRRVVEKVIASAPPSIGLGVINYGGHDFPATANGVKYPVRLLTEEQRTGLLDGISEFEADGFTPIVQSLFEASLYFRGDDAFYGNHLDPIIRAAEATLEDASLGPIVSQEIVEQRCVLGDPVCEAKGFSRESTNCTVIPAQPAGSFERRECEVFDEAGKCLVFGDVTETVEVPASPELVECTFEGVEDVFSFNQRYDSPISNECQANFIVLLSDGEPDDGITPGSDPQIRAKIEGTYGLNCVRLTGDSADGTCGAELTHYLATTDLNDSFDEVQTVQTYTIGFANTASGNDYLASLANLGENPEGKTASFSAEDENRLLQVLNDIIDDIAGNVGLLTPPVFSEDGSTGFTTGTDAYLPLFKPSQLPAWTGNLKKYLRDGGVLVGENGKPLFNVDGTFSDDVRSFWSAEVDGSSVEKGGAASLLTKTRKLLTNVNGQLVPLTEGIVAASLVNEEEGISAAELFHYAQGLEAGSDLPRKSMGALLNSRPVVVSYDHGDVIFAGSNDGYLYAIDAESGQELFSFMPSILIPNLKILLNNDPKDAHPYGVDGDLTVFRSDNGHVYLYIGLRRGGRDYYALDITDPAHPKMQWRIEGGRGSFSTLGQTWSKPIVTKIESSLGATPLDAVLFGGGYDPAQDGGCMNEEVPLAKCPVGERIVSARQVDNQGNSVFAVNAYSGELLWSIGAGNASYFEEDMDNSIPANLAVVDIDSNGVADRIYAADTGGRVFRVDLPDSDNARILDRNKVDEPSVHLLADLSGHGIEGHRRFYHEPDVAIVREGLRRFVSIAIGSGYHANPLLKGGMAAQERLYVLKDYGVTGLSSTTEALNNADLVNATNSIAASAPNGWYIDLDRAAGEKALARAVTLDGTVHFTTFSPATPPENVCTSPLHSGAVYSLNVRNAAAALVPGELGPSIPTIDGRKQTFQTADIPTEVYQTFTKDEQGRVVVETFLGPSQGQSKVDTTVFDAVQKVYWEQVR